jgi:putative copper export protein
MDLAGLLGPLSRGLSLVAMLPIVGAVVFRYGLLRSVARTPDGEPDGARHRAVLVGLVASLLLALALGGKLTAQLLAFADPDEGLTADLVAAVVGASAWGRGFTLQIVAAGLAIVAFAVARMAPGLGWVMSAAAATAVALAAPLTGHATGTTAAGSWGYPLDVLHVLGGGAWLGTLAVLLLAGLPAAGRDADGHRAHRRIAAMVTRFSPIALTGAGVAIVAGLALAFRYLDGVLPSLWTSRYGRTLLVKLALLAMMMGLGAWNWRVGSRQLGSADGSARIRQSSTIELALGTALLAVTALLVAMPMPGEE